MGDDVVTGELDRRWQAQARPPRVASGIVVSHALARTLEQRPAITVLCTPRGFGKTSAVAAWVRNQDQADIRYVWVALPVRAITRAEFWSEVYLALTGSRPAAGHDPYDALLVHLEGRLQPTTLILDNFTHVSDETVDDELGAMIARFERLRLVVMLRMERAIVAIADAHPAAAVLRMPELAVDGAGALTIAADAGYNLSEEEARKTADAVAGWPALVRMWVQENSQAEHGSLMADWQGVERYCQLVLSDPDMQRFRGVLAALSCAGEFEAELGQMLIGEDDWKTVFPIIHQAGVLDSWLQDGIQYYRIKPRLNAAVQAVIRRQDRATYCRLHHAVATWYDDRGLGERALRHAVEAEDWQQAGRLLEDFWLELVTGHADQTRRMLRQLPEPMVRTSTKLLVMRDYILNVDPVGWAAAAFRSGRMDVEFATAHENQRLTLSQTLQLRSSGQYESCRQLIEDTGHQGERSAWADKVLEQLPELLLQWSITTLLTSDMASAAYAFRQAYRWARDRGMSGAKREAASGLALCLAILGHLNSAADWVRRVDELPPSPNTSDLERAARVLVREIIAGDRLRFSDVPQHAKLRLSRGLPGFDAVSQYVTASALLHRGSADEQETAISAAERELANLTPGRHGARITAATARAAIVDLCIATSQFKRAHRALADVEGRPSWGSVAQARLALFEGRPDAVCALTDHIGAVATVDIRHGLQAHLLRACAALRMERIDRAGDNLQEAVSLAEEAGMVRPFALIPRSDLIALDAAFPHVIPEHILGAVTAAPEVFPTPREPVHLSARELEVLRQIATEMPLSQVARRLFVTENTVKSQVRSIYRKLQVHTRVDAIDRAAALGLLPRSESHGPAADVATLDRRAAAPAMPRA